MPEYLNIQPSPISLIESLREIGYSMETAIADIMDNSITSGASSIHLRFAWNNGEPWLAIIDDGSGMSADEVTSAMRLGSNNPLNTRSVEDLGRFGLGFKNRVIFSMQAIDGYHTKTTANISKAMGSGCHYRKSG